MSDINFVPLLILILFIQTMLMVGIVSELKNIREIFEKWNNE